MAASADLRDEEWMVNKAKFYRKNDPSAARSWLIVARTLFPRNFSIQFEMYQLEKSSQNVQDMVRLFEDMLANFFNEPQLWTEIRAMSEALQSEATDEQSVFLREVFTSLAKEIQCRILLRVAETSTDVLQQCRLRLLIVDRYPSQVPDQGEKLVESLLQAEHVLHVTSPVNQYRRYLACSVLPLLLCGGQPKPTPRSLCQWLHKAVEFYICFIAQKTLKATSSSNSSDRKTVSPAVTNTSAALLDVADSSSSFPDKDDHIVDPWHQLCQLIHLAANHLQWNIGRLFQGDSLDCQWQQIVTMSEALRLSQVDPSRKEIQLHEVLLCGTVLLIQCLLAYMAAVDSSTTSSQGQPSGHLSYALVEFFQLEPAAEGSAEPKWKRLKSEDNAPKIFISGKVSPHSPAEDMIQNFLTALNCWHLLNSPVLEKEFKKLGEHWSVDKWPVLFRFEIDVFMYQGYYTDVISRLQPIQSAQSSTTSQHRQMSLQLACCYYSISKYTDVVDMILYIIGNFQPNAGSPLGQETQAAPQSKGRQLCLLPLVESEIFSYCVHLLIACLRDRAWKLSPSGELSPNYAANSAQLDMVIGHMMVLMQHNWPKYEPMMCEIVTGIKKRGHFAYSLFFNYVINIDFLEEFAFLRTPEGGRVNLDILPTSPGKAGSQPRTVTRGVNKGAKEDFKAAMERQITRTEENVSLLLRTFILDEADIITQNLQA